MNSESAKHFGATDFNGVVTQLSKSECALSRLSDALGPIDGPIAIEMMCRGELVGGVGDTTYDFFLDDIENEAEIVWSGTTYDQDDEDNPDSRYPVGISEYCGVFFVWALEYENAGYFLSREDALQYVEGNWDNVREGA